MADSYHKLGQAQAANRERPAAHASYRQALALLENQPKRYAQERKWQQARALIYRNISSLETLSGDTARASENARQAQTILAAIGPDVARVENESDEAAGYRPLELGILAKQAGDLPSALAHFQRRERT